jgi:hypothetical protein
MTAVVSEGYAWERDSRSCFSGVGEGVTPDAMYPLSSDFRS